MEKVISLFRFRLRLLSSDPTSTEKFALRNVFLLINKKIC